MYTDTYNISVIKKASIRPNKIVFYNQVLRTYLTPQEPKKPIIKGLRDELACLGFGTKLMPLNNKHQFEISYKAAARIKEKVSWLYELARNKTVQTTGGKVLNSFKMNFLTLTLPSLQRHNSATITKECLNQFLTECKTKFDLENYVWRLEFQKNGNIHYHLATDTYIDYVSAKLIWNRCLNKLGYIREYQNKFIGMTFENYCKEYSNNGKTPFNILRERYGRGCATRWDSPNTVDVRAVSNAKNIAFYISKYITKKSEHSLNSIVSLREPSDTNLRLWFCSRSLSKLSAIEVFLEEYNTLVNKCFEGLTNIKKYVFDYVSVWYFNSKDQPNETKQNFWYLFRQYSKELGYTPSL
jgi:hypothetical protein